MKTWSSLCLRLQNSQNEIQKSNYPLSSEDINIHRNNKWVWSQGHLAAEFMQKKGRPVEKKTHLSFSKYLTDKSIVLVRGYSYSIDTKPYLEKQFYVILHEVLIYFCLILTIFPSIILPRFLQGNTHKIAQRVVLSLPVFWWNRNSTKRVNRIDSALLEKQHKLIMPTGYTHQEAAGQRKQASNWGVEKDRERLFLESSWHCL